MKQFSLHQNKFHSYHTHPLCEGCKQCVLGRKSVIYITGLCPRHCFYCPLSDNRRGKDVMFANERKVNLLSEIIEEVRICKSTGAGFTGGDPLVKLARTCEAITLLKKKFGKNFHIHLYTSLNLVRKETLDALFSAGLDEIRFHPDLDDKTLWSRLTQARVYPWKKGIEIPAIPGYDERIWDLFDYAHSLVDFFNVNELEISDTNGHDLSRRGFVCKNKQTYAIKGSQELALRLVKRAHSQFPNLPIHYCTVRLKDGTQLANRLKIRAQSIRKPYDLVDEEGMLLRGVIHADPSHDKIILGLIKTYNIPKKYICSDPSRNQILIAPWVLSEIYQEIPYDSSFVKEYPTWDRLIVEVTPLLKKRRLKK